MLKESRHLGATVTNYIGSKKNTLMSLLLLVQSQIQEMGDKLGNHCRSATLLSLKVNTQI